MDTKSKISQSRKNHNKSSKKHDANKKHQQQEDDVGITNSWICKNASCRANVPKDDSFCKRCSCCVCHSFDENKDPSLWLVCESEKPNDVEFCGLSCHVECAFREDKVGVTSIGNLMKLDGCFCCYSCGKVSEILGCWKKQLVAAKDARRRDVLCYRIEMSYRLLDGTCRFSELHEVVKAAKSMLEDEVGPLDGPSARTDRGIVSRLPVASDVQELCTSAIKMAEDWSANIARDSIPAACRFHFEDVASTRVTLRLIELPSAEECGVTGYRLWCFKKGETPEDDQFLDLSRAERRILLADLDPCKEYMFRVVSYTEAGCLGHSNARCVTKSVEILRDNSVEGRTKRRINVLGNDQASDREEKSSISSGFQIGQLGKYVELAEAQEDGLLDAFYDVDTDKSSEPEEEVPPRRPLGFDLNVVSVPDLNEEFTQPDSSGGEDNRYFELMRNEYCIVASPDHYSCVVSLLCRSGKLKEAYDLIKAMPVEPHASAWGSVLGGCSVHGDSEIAEVVARRLFELEPQSAGNYVLLSNMYAALDRWADVALVRDKMKENGIKKISGRSWTGR